MDASRSELDMVECPYNKTHRMQRKRLQPHLIKCRVRHPNVELQKCPFNNSHLIPEPEFENHVTSCPGRKLITQYKYNVPEQRKQEEEHPQHAPIECEDNWDDIEVEDYNPRKHADMSKIILRPNCVSQAERKARLQKELAKGDVYLQACRQEAQRNDKKQETVPEDEGLFARRRQLTPPPPTGLDWSFNRHLSPPQIKHETEGRERTRSRSPVHKKRPPINHEYHRKGRECFALEYNLEDNHNSSRSHHSSTENSNDSSHVHNYSDRLSDVRLFLPPAFSGAAPRKH